MQRYLRVLRLFWSTALAAEMEYRANFLAATLTSVIGLAGSVYGLFLLYRVGYEPGGWTWAEALLVMGIFTLLEGLSATVLTPNLSRIVQYVQQGTLDFVLLKPIDSQFWLSARNFSPWGLPNVAFGLALVLYAGRKAGVGWLDFAAGVGPILLGAVILYSLWFILATTTVWFVKIYNVTEVLRGFLEAGRFPMAAYPVAYRVFFTFVVPVAFLTTVPAEAMLGRGRVEWLVGAGFLAVGLLAFSRWFWRFALRYYTSASS